MKKLKLKALALGATEILTREQLKSIMGGCFADSDCPSGQKCNSGATGGDGGCYTPTGGIPGIGGSGSSSCPAGTHFCSSYGCTTSPCY